MRSPTASWYFWQYIVIYIEKAVIHWSKVL
jgi:hypothetical protein